MKLLKTIIILTLFCACKNTNSTETPKNATSELDSLPIVEEQKEEKILYATVDKLRLRKSPGSKGAVIEQVKEGAPLRFLEEKTDYKDKIKLRDQWLEEPWLKVASEQGNTGWVFGGAVTETAPKVDITKTPYDDCEKAFVRTRDRSAYNDCYQKIAKVQLAKDARHIKATENGYQVTLLDGDTRNLVNENGSALGSEFREYSYRYYLDKMGFFVFKVYRLEAGHHILMNDKFGYATPIYGMPKISPDQKKIVIYNADANAGFEFNGIQLLEMSNEGVNTLFEEEFDDFAPHNPVWIDNKQIEFDFLSPESADEQRRVKAKLVEDKMGNWNLTIDN